MNTFNWEQFGLRKNPYDISPLVEGGDINVSNAFVGREQEQEYIDTLFASEERVSFAICGDVGVGKTSMINHQKFFWKYNAKQKPLFSFRREIEATEYLLNKKSFILEVIGSVIAEIDLLEPKLVRNNAFFQKMLQLIDITQTLGISGNISSGIPGIFNAEAQFSGKQLLPPVHLTNVAVEKSFTQLMDFILTHKINGIPYKGLIIHVNNFDVVMESYPKQTKQFFAEIRDFLQTSHIYCVFLGPAHFYKDIISTQNRVKSIFIQQPLLLEPLTKKELVIAFNKRLKLLRSDNVKKVIKPFADEVIYALYDLFAGDIRLVMAALRDILTKFSNRLPQTLTVDESFFLLAQERMARIEKKLTSEQRKVLGIIVKGGKPVTQADIAKQLNKAPTNISYYYFKKLADLEVIEVKQENSKLKYWYLTKEYLPLQESATAQKNLQQRFNQAKR